MNNYVDPGAGAFMLQMAIATLVGFGYSLRNRIRRLFGRVPAAPAVVPTAVDPAE